MRPRFLALAVALLVPATTLAGKWESPLYASGAARPRRIVVLPATAQMVRGRLNDAVPFVKETRIFEQALRSEAAGVLATRGYEADLESASPERIAADRDLQGLVRDLDLAVGAMIDVAAGRPKDIGRGRFSVGEAVLPLAARTGAEGFLWLQSRSIVPSKGTRALASVFSVLSGSYGVPTNQTQLVAVLVDGRSGDLVSVTVAAVGGAVLKEPEQVAAHVVREALQQWAMAGASQRVPEKRMTAASAAEKPRVAAAGDAIDEGALLARFDDAVARLEGRPTAGLPEDVVTRDDFTVDGAPIAADGANAATPVSLFEPPSASATLAGGHDATAPDGGAEPRPPLPNPRALWDVEPASRPAPTRQIVLQMLDGATSVRVRNMVPPDVLVSIDLGRWTRLALGEEVVRPTTPGSHRVLVTDLDGRELVRVNVLANETLASIELWGM